MNRALRRERRRGRVPISSNLSAEVTHGQADEWLASLQGELRYLLNRWDPLNVYDDEVDYPPDEYDSLIGPLLVRLGRGDSGAQVSEFLWWEIADHFRIDPVVAGTDAFADRLLAWFRAK